MAEEVIQVQNFQEAINLLICILGRNDPFHDMSTPIQGNMTNNRIVGASNENGKVVRFDWDEATGSHINVTRNGQRYNINWGYEGSDAYLWALQEINGTFNGNAQGFLYTYMAVYFNETIYNQVRNLI